MSSTAKTPHLGLNQWEATDAPQRVDFNTDNQRIDAAIDGGRQQMDDMALNLEEVNHDIYRLYLQQYYDNKDVPHRATMFFDAFRDASMMDASTTAYHNLSAFCLCNWDKRFYSVGSLTFDSSCWLSGSLNEHYVGVAQSYPAAGPVRLSSLSLTYKPSYISGSSHSINLSLYAADAQGVPQTLRQVLTTFTRDITGGGENFAVNYNPASPLLINDANFAFALENSTLGGSQYLQIGTRTQLGPQGPVYGKKYGGAWAQQSVTSNNRMGVTVVASQLNSPPKWVTKEIVLSRPCSKATVFVTQDAASAARNAVRIALYNAGETPVYMNMTHNSTRDLPLSDGKCEACYTYEQTAHKTRARLTLQMDGTNAGDRIYEYGCVLSD